MLGEVAVGLNDIEMYGSASGYAYLFIDGDLVKVLHIDNAKEVEYWGETLMYTWEYEDKYYCLPAHEFEDKTK